jgi:hypothetical protein
MAQSYYKLEASLTTSPYKPINPRLSCLIPKDNKPEFNLEYLRFAF